MLSLLCVNYILKKLTIMELKDKLQKIFNGDYPGTEVFIRDVICRIFGNEIKYKKLDLAEDTAYHDKAERAGIKHLCYVADIVEQNYNAGKIALFDVTLDDRKNIERSRVNIQQLIRSVVQDYYHILMVFHYEDAEGKSWRFSYAYKQDTLANTTSAKRYTYVFGRDFRGRTAAERFCVLAQSERKDSDFVDAFSVEALSNEFFDLYRAYYATFVEYIIGEKYTDEKKLNNIIKAWNWRTNDTTNQFATTFDSDAKATRDYIKKMFGRIVFLYFLQRKGWLYNSEGKSDAQYMRHLYEKAEQKGLADRFLDDVLEILFFYILNTKEPEKRIENAKLERGKDVRIIPGWDKIPFLNGGLFQDDDIDRLPCVFPASYFRELFTFLDSYNFTIDENDQEDAEVGIDPEMLGRIFENLLEDNKDKGAFYTPKEIVDYMCRESLIAYLQDNKFSKEGNNLIRTFVETMDKQGLSNDQRVYLRDKLKAVKICDPAIGSGAFPMGLINLLAKLYISLGVSSEEMANIKRHIMEKNIYGVDIEQGAVDIARLRFWLAMVVDEPEPTPLPNLHFKIMQGNSLLESFKGRDLSGLMTGTGDFFADSEREQLNQLVNDFYNEQSHIERSSKLEQIRNNIRKQIYFLTNDEQSDLDPIANDKFFLWHTWFADVFKNGGFDIVIGNPPYLKEGRASKNIFTPVKSSPYYKGKMDIWYMFACQGIDMLKPEGNLCFIATNNWITSDGASKLRNKVTADAQIVQMCDFRSYMIFDSASIQTMIMQFKKSNQYKEYKFDLRSLLGSTLKDVIMLLNKENGETTEFQTPKFVRSQMKDKFFTFGGNND
ncbi:MAG: N-6 DNA methylase, partial [Prevotella sp.]|nr:N-6 DNA methylase [Prevotella sp.]